MRRATRTLSLALLIAVTTVTGSAAQRIHTVASGQTLGGIAKKYGISVAELRDMNRLPVGAGLKPGARLLIPEPGEVARNQRLSAEKAARAKQAPPAAEPQPAATEPQPTATELQPAPELQPAASPTETATDSSAPDTVAPAEREPVNDPAARRDNPDREPKTSAAPTPPAPRTRSVVPRSDAGHQRHEVASGHTLGKIAKRYHVGVDALRRLNGLRRTDQLKPGMTLIIPNGDDDPMLADATEPEPATPATPAAPKSAEASISGQLSVPGAGPVYYYEPLGAGRKSMRPILVYLHGRGNDPEADCRHWAPVARRFGWLICPSGPVAHNSGRAWNNSWPSGQHAVMGSIHALREKFGRRVQLFGNTLIGFSEGAFVAMNVGVREPHTFNRWLILGADTSYWGGSGLEALKDAQNRVRRVVLITGARDQVVEDTRKVAGWLEGARVPLRLQTPGDLAHEVALERMPGLYESALRWLDRGGGPSSKVTKR